MSRPVVLAIDTTSEQASVSLTVAGKDYTTFWQCRGKVEELLNRINRVLKQAKLKLKSVSRIEVNPGPGSFIGTRSGVTVANTLGWLLGVPVNGKNPPIAVKYGRYGVA